MSEWQEAWEFMKTPQYWVWVFGQWFWFVVLIYQVQKYERWKGRYTDFVKNRSNSASQSDSMEESKNEP